MKSFVAISVMRLMSVKVKLYCVMRQNTEKKMDAMQVNVTYQYKNFIHNCVHKFFLVTITFYEHSLAMEKC